MIEALAGQAGQSRARGRALLAQVAAPLLAAALAALVWANSPWSDAYESLWATEISVRVGGDGITMDLAHWVNDGLMAIFFLVIGLEVRRELSMGELTERRRLALPAIAALSGLAVPALLYLAVNPSGAAADGWGVVIGTDTAFLLGALAVVGPACPTQLRVFLLTVTIFDDIVAIAIIGLVYSESLDAVALAVAAAALVGLAAFGRMRIWWVPAYWALGLVLWVATLESGLHPTIAGMAAGLVIGAHPPRREDVERAASLFRAFRQSPLPDVGYSAKRGLERAVSVNERLQARLHPLASFVVVPVFALANAGVDLGGGLLEDALTSPVTWGVVLGLVGGKLAGIGLAALATVRLGIGSLPQGVGMGQTFGGAALSGIGFTVSLLIAGLAFGDESLRDEATVGVLLAGALAVLSGWIVFRLAAVLRGERTASLPMLLAEPVDPGRDHIRGPAGAPLTLVEYSDFECPFCGKATGVVRELRERFGDDLRYVVRHLPLTDVHGYAEIAAQAAEAAAAQGRFWEMHDVLFAHQGELELEDLVGYAGELGLDVERFVRELQEGVHAQRVRDDVIGAEASGARGTPTFFIGERRHVGPYDTEALARELVASRGA